jgi:ELWxxDGT repeat protein
MLRRIGLGLTCLALVMVGHEERYDPGDEEAPAALQGAALAQSETPAPSGPAYLLADWGVRKNWSAAWAPSGVVPLGERLVFQAYDDGNGRELWVYDSATEEVRLLRDIRPGFEGGSSNSFQALNGIAWFRANDGQQGSTLWQTDGTPEGTHPWVALGLGPEDTGPYPQATSGGWLYFTVWNPQSKWTLWRTDGTPSGAQRLDLAGELQDNEPRGFGDHGGHRHRS